MWAVDDRYRVTEGERAYVEHRDDSGAWCGPLIPSAEHSRAGELPEDVICIACGDFCEGVDADTVRTVKRLVAAMDREDAAADERAKDIERLRAAGVDVSKLPPPKPKPRRRRTVQHKLPGVG